VYHRKKQYSFHLYFFQLKVITAVTVKEYKDSAYEKQIDVVPLVYIGYGHHYVLYNKKKNKQKNKSIKNL
jgi:general stress protein CsbA